MSGGANATFSPVTIWPFLLLMVIVVAALAGLARHNIQFTILTLMILFATLPSFKDKPKTANIEYVHTPFFTVGCTWPLRCIDGTVIGRQCQPDYVVIGALGRWGTLSVLTLSEDAGRLVYSFSAQGKVVSSYFKSHVIAPLTHLLTPSPPKKEL